MTHQRDCAPSKISETRHDRAVVSKTPIAMNLEKIPHQQIDIVQSLRPIRMPRQAHALNRTQ
jgi:hypothetical protein